MALKRIAELLDDGEARELMIRRLKEGGHVANEPPPVAAGGAGTFMFPSASRSITGGSPSPPFPMQFPFATPFSPFWGPWTAGAAPTGQTLPAAGSTSSLGQPGSASSQGQVKGEYDSNVVDLLDDEEALDFANFDPMINDDNAWDAGEVINAFLEKHFNRVITPEEREAMMNDFPNPSCQALAIMNDFPKPSCQALVAPKLDEDMKKQIKKAGKDPHFGAERSLFKLQLQLLDMAGGPLTCLWAEFFFTI